MNFLWSLFHSIQKLFQAVNFYGKKEALFEHARENSNNMLAIFQHNSTHFLKNPKVTRFY